MRSQRYWGLMLEGGKHGARVMPDMSVGMDRGAMPKVAVADTSECVAEWSRLMAERGQRLAAGAKPKAAKQSGGCMMSSYNVYGLKVGPEGMPVIVGIRSRCT